jgi:hypothetical protein
MLAKIALLPVKNVPMRAIDVPMLAKSVPKYAKNA